MIQMEEKLCCCVVQWAGKLYFGMNRLEPERLA